MFYSSPVVLALLIGANGARAIEDRERADVGQRIDFARLAPGEVGFFVEINDLARMQQRLEALHIWTIIQQLTEQAGATNQPFQARARHLFGMPPEAVIRHLLGNRSALFANSPNDWQKGVIVAELPPGVDLDLLLQRWRPESLSNQGRVRQFRLPTGLLLGVRDRILVMGPKDDPDGLWARSLVLVSGKDAPALADRSEFAGMRARLGHAHDGMAFASWQENDPTAWSDCKRLVVGFSLTEEGVRCELHGQRRRPGPPLSSCRLDDVRRLPADTLAAWTGGFDPEQIERPTPGSIIADDQSLIGMFLDLVAALGENNADSHVDLGPQATVVLGAGDDAERNQPSIPPLTIFCDARRVDEHVRRLDTAIGLLSSVMSVTARSDAGTAVALKIERRRCCDDVELRFVNVGRLISQRFGLEILKGLEICWAGDGEKLLLSTSTMHLESILMSLRHADDKTGSGFMAQVVSNVPVERVAQWGFMRGRRLANLLRNWLAYIGREYPNGLRDSTWRVWARDRLARNDRLGVALKDDPSVAGRSVVVDVENGSPAAGRLLPGDVVVRAGGKKLPDTHASREVANRYRQRGEDAEFTMRVERGTEELDVRIPVSLAHDVNLGDMRPIGALRQLSRLLQPVEYVTFSQEAGDASRIDAHVFVQWTAESRGIDRMERTRKP